MSPFLQRYGDDGNLADTTMQAWFAPENRMTLKWESEAFLTNILRCQFG